jgi:hypothetical protein
MGGIGEVFLDHPLDKRKADIQGAGRKGLKIYSHISVTFPSRLPSPLSFTSKITKRLHLENYFFPK